MSLNATTLVVRVFFFPSITRHTRFDCDGGSDVCSSDLKLYPIENAQVQKALDDLTATTKHLLDVEKEIELRMQGEFIFVNSTRLRLDLDNYASFSHILGVLRQSGIGAVRIDEGVERKQLQIFVAMLLSYAAKR